MTFTKPDSAYWSRKFIAYMHDPLDKIFRIQGHGDRAAQFIAKYGLEKPNEAFWKKADAIAAGFERGQVPSFSSDENRNGAVDFLQNSIITHPTSEKCHLTIAIPERDDQAVNRINEKLIEYIENEIGMKPGGGGYSDHFKSDEEGFAVARFLYTHLVLRFKLAENNVAGLGGFWHRIPADTRFPDHSIWQHNALCSALSSCIELAGNDSEIGLMVFSITPVQPFIAKARKLRDYWTGSVLLSWLAFEGIKWVVENLGPDHVMYPSLVDQPLINQYLEKQWEVENANFLNRQNDIASFPNKFLFIAPLNMADDIAAAIKTHMGAQWESLYSIAAREVIHASGELSGPEKERIGDMFSRQNSNYWEFQWAAANLLTLDNKAEIENLLPASAYENQFDVLKSFNRIIEDMAHYDKSGKGILYSVSHALVQSALASAKTVKKVLRQEEPGEKCHLCGEFEVLHSEKYEGKKIPAGDYKSKISRFWERFKENWDGPGDNPISYDLKSNERLCTVCLLKRIAYKAVGNCDGHILMEAFKEKKQFKTTTEFALHDFYRRHQTPEDEKKQKAQVIHEKAEDEANNRDRYYAILMMDGDKMGKLVNGETLASTWESIMHPDIVRRLADKEFDRKYRDNWKDIFDKKRLLTPAIHAAISEALADFSIYGVAPIIEKHGGALIYAGGDDVCAILPRETALSAAKEIRQYYISTFKVIEKDKQIKAKDVGEEYAPHKGKLSINLGKGERISISAGILLCHHKENLSLMIKRAHELLNGKAKSEAGRDACAIELRKRSGGSRYFVRKWPGLEEKNKSTTAAWEAFETIGETIQDKKKAQVSASLVYRLEKFRAGIEAILDNENYNAMLTDFIAAQLERSSIGNTDTKKMFAEKITKIVVEDKGGKRLFKPEGLIVAAFMAQGGDDD